MILLYLSVDIAMAWAMTSKSGSLLSPASNAASKAILIRRAFVVTSLFRPEVMTIKVIADDFFDYFIVYSHFLPLFTVTCNAHVTPFEGLTLENPSMIEINLRRPTLE